METPERQGDRLIKPAEAAAIFGVDRKSLSNWANAGKLTVKRTLGGHRRYWESECRALANGDLKAVA